MAQDKVISEEEAAALLEKRPGEAQPLDLAKLRITHGRLPMLELLYRTFAGQFARALSALLKREAQVELQRIETVKVGDFTASLSQPACLSVLALKPLKGGALIAIDPALISVLVDSFFGGAGRAAHREPQAGLTPAEQRFVVSLVRQMCGDLKQAWTSVSPVEFEFSKLESNPQFLNLGAPGDGLLSSRFHVEVSGSAGAIDLVMPEAALEPVREALRGPGASTRHDAATSQWPAILREYLKQAVVEVRGVLAQTRVSLNDVMQLKPGDIMPIEAPSTAQLLVGDVAVHSAKFGISRGRNALKVTGPVLPATRTSN